MVHPSDADYYLPRQSVRTPIPELFECAWVLDRAVSAHLDGHQEISAELFAQADMVSVRDYVESLWGKASLWPDQVHYKRLRKVDNLPPPEPRARERMPSAVEKRQLIIRDGYNCRYCGIPVIPAEVRKAVVKDYPTVVSWGSTNVSQHAGFQALWLQYDHVLPSALGGTSEINNMVISCSGCNFLKWNYHLEQLGVIDPRSRPVLRTSWDGLVRYIGNKTFLP